MHCIGIDIIEIARIEGIIARWGECFLQRVYTKSEIKLYRHNLSSLAARFAGKEAVIKALRTGNKAICWKEIEILSEPSGKPLVRLYGRAKSQAHSLGLATLGISLSHSKQHAIALVTGEAR